MRSVEECWRGSSVRVFRLSRESVVARLRERALRLLERRPDVLEVRLVGSLARGDALPGSDADLVVLLRDGAPPFRERMPDLARHFAAVGVGCDLLPYTESEWRTMRAEAGRFVRTALAEGVVLAARS